MQLVKESGEFVVLMLETIRRPDKWKMFRRQLFIDMQHLGTDSIGLVAFISVFTGAIIALQVSYNLDNPLIPASMVGYMTREMMILEFAPTIISLILAGKVGSLIASEIGTMRVTEQIDALRVMGINPPNYLILPKMVAAMIYFPILIVFSMVLGLFGGWVAGVFSGLVPSDDFILGLRSWFNPFSITYALIKTVVFAVIITSISGFKGYTVSGGSVEVGQNSTKAVVYSSILIIIWDLILTQLLLV
jgi:phospholipid/cholesterol/gamma-HCH transport system permease protein